MTTARPQSASWVTAPRRIPTAFTTKMQETLKAAGYDNYFVGTVEATPSLDDVIAAVKAGGYKKVVLRPLMIVAGDHAQ